MYLPPVINKQENEEDDQLTKRDQRGNQKVMQFQIRQVIEVSETEPRRITIISTEVISIEGGWDLGELAIDLLTDIHKLKAYRKSQYTGLALPESKRYVAVVTPLKNRGTVRIALDCANVQLRGEESFKTSPLFPYMKEWEFDKGEEVSKFINNINLI